VEQRSASLEGPQQRAECFSVEDVNWGLVFQRLVTRAHRIKDYRLDIFDGMSVEDVVNNAFVAFFSDEHQLGWNPRRGTLETFLWTIIRRDMMDHFRRGGRTSSLDDDTVRFAVERKNILTVDPQSDLNKVHMAEHVKYVAVGDLELESLVAVAGTVEGPNINQQLAAHLRTTPNIIANLKKRLRRLMRKSEAGAPWKKT
jgi:hypothetical protein